MADGPVIGPRRTDGRAYEQALRRDVLDPLLAELRNRIQQAGLSYVAIREAIRNVSVDPALDALTEAEARRVFAGLNAWHRERFRRAMRRYFGVRVDLLRDTPIDLATRIRENVRLVRTIPTRFHEGLAAKLEAIAVTAPFDQKRVRDVLAREYRSSGYNLRRLTRDQTSKLTGQLNQARQTELGVDRYRWRDSADERVRPLHQDYNGQIFAWNDPPPDGHPGQPIQCRCVAVAVLDTP